MKALRASLPLALPLLLASLAPFAHADTIAWTDWTAGASGSPGSASGTLTTAYYGNINITYSGQTSGLLTDYPSWTPVATFTGGIVGNAPPALDNSVGLEGGVTYTETIIFSKAIEDPILAIWSLGSGGTSAYFDFAPGSSFTVQGSGGGSSEYGGTGLAIAGNSIYGNEGNGVVQFNGLYTSLTFTTPNYENYYAFTIGEDDTLTSTTIPTLGTSATPEPSSIYLLGLGIAAIPGLRRKLSRR